MRCTANTEPAQPVPKTRATASFCRETRITLALVKAEGEKLKVSRLPAVSCPVITLWSIPRLPSYSGSRPTLPQRRRPPMSGLAIVATGHARRLLAQSPSFAKTIHVRTKTRQSTTFGRCPQGNRALSVRGQRWEHARTGRAEGVSWRPRHGLRGSGSSHGHSFSMAKSANEEKENAANIKI
jgi:hypothetical protein